MGSNKKAVIHTLLYSHLFNAALTIEELHYFWQSAHPATLQEVKDALSSYRDTIIMKNGYVALKNYPQTIDVSQEKREFSDTKLRLAITVGRYLSLIPSVLFVGVSGSVAAMNAAQDDDIDLFVITADRTLFSSRLLLLLLLQLSGKRRKRQDAHPNNKFCLNMLVTESGMAFPKKFQDIYTAREIMQLYPLFDRDKTYERFLEVNSWTHKILPNAKGRAVNFRQLKKRPYKLLVFFEPIVRSLELLIISSHKTTETIGNDRLAFHPNDARKTVISQFHERLHDQK